VNFLAHLFLSGGDRGLLAGNLMGDFVKGGLAGRYPASVERGIELHRAIDAFAGGNAFFLRSKRRLLPAIRHYRGIMVDLFYDHFLALHWGDYGEGPYLAFVEEVYRVARDYREAFPARLQRLLPALFEEWLPSYPEVGGIERALRRMAARLERPNPLGEGGEELRRCYKELEEDFSGFFPQVMEHVNAGGRRGASASCVLTSISIDG
jgi:acyl carrier protein phosphodiesterase